MTKIKKNYTLIELLVVIAIIAVLAGLLFPTIGLVRARAADTRGVSECNAIATALRQYKMAYYKFPVSLTAPVGGDAAAPATSASSLGDYDKIMFALTGILPGGGADNSEFVKLNRKKTAFLDATPEYMKDGGFYANQWGRRFYIYYGNDRPLTFNRPVNGATGETEIKVGSDVAVYSEMKPGTTQFTQGKRLYTSWGGVQEF